jgi:hypothetical protein
MTEVPHFRPGNFSRDHFDAHQNLVRPKAPLDGGDLVRNQLEFFLTNYFHRGSQKAWEAFSNIIYFVRAIQNSEDSLRGEEAIFVLDNITKIYTRASNPLQTLALALQPNPGLDERQRWLGELENILTPYFGGEELISEYRGALGLERAREEESDEDHESLRTRAPSPRSSFDEDQEDQEDQRSDDAESDPLLVASRSPGRIEGIEEEAESNILILLSDLRKKGHQLFREGHVDDGRQALECAIQIQFKLAQVGSRFLESRSPSMPEVAPPARNTQGVLQECVALLQGARPALENHRGFGKVLNVLLNIFTGLLTAFIAPVAHRCVMGHWSFNSVVFKTRSVQKVDQLKDALQEGLQAG